MLLQANRLQHGCETGKNYRKVGPRGILSGVVCSPRLQSLLQEVEPFILVHVRIRKKHTLQFKGGHKLRLAATIYPIMAH
jgi:hypothetical protein